MTGRSLGILAGSAAIMAGCAVQMPAEYMGIATGAPIPPDDLARIEAGKAHAKIVGRGCPWPGRDNERQRLISCALLPASQLAGLAWSGHKPATLELGARFEEGRGVPQDFDRALSLYTAAATATGGDIWIYSPGINGQPGQVMPFSVQGEPGLPEARRRLDLLKAWREQRDDPALRHCPTPREGTAELAARPAAPAEIARRDKAIAEGRLGRGKCLWRKSEAEITTIPCDHVPLPELAAMAGAGDRHAMLELGIRFERGRGVARDLAQAEAFTCIAGRTRITGGGESAKGWKPLTGVVGLEDARRRWERLRRAR